MKLKIKKIFALSCLLPFGATVALAEDASIAEYRFVNKIGQIQISAGGMDRTPSLASEESKLEEQGIIVLETNRGRTFSKTENVGKHRVETTLTMAPPVGHGEGGATSFIYLKIILDGAVRVDCPFWNGWMGLDRVTVDVNRGFVWLIGYSGRLRFDGFESKKVIDQKWLEDHAQSTKQYICNQK